MLRCSVIEYCRHGGSLTMRFCLAAGGRSSWG
jgi:hypothetical protein